VLYRPKIVVAAALMVFITACSTPHQNMRHTSPALQKRLEEIDVNLRARFGMTPEQTAIGILNLNTGEAAMIHPDRIEYAASVAKIGILLAWVHLHQNGAIDPQTRHELGLMIKASSNEMATKFSEQIGLVRIQEIINSYGFYDANGTGGIWVGKHYGKSGERIPDPIGHNSHAVTIRQLLRFYELLDHRKLISKGASETMLQIFESPEIPHDQHKFVKGLAGRNVKILRKWGSWENYLHDTAIITGPGRNYVLAALTNHPDGDAYLEALAQQVDDEMQARASK
jgi:beta-lactamase class A